MKNSFALALLKWNKEKNQRLMPWKGEKNPYYIWLSEIILQQTRVEQGMPYYLSFKKKYPTVKRLADAPEDEVLRLWQGLGYYSRARNLHETAKNVTQNFKGKFPECFDELIGLKGIGDYTAAAISSFAFGERRAVVDGNVIRVLARVFGIEEPFDTSAGKAKFRTLAQKLIDDKDPGAYNQAIMDFGAVICTPKNPLCEKCPFKKKCVARLGGRIEELPLRGKRIKITNRYFHYLLIKSAEEIFIQKRTGNDIWKNLYELPMIESEKPRLKNRDKLVAKLLGTSDFHIRASSSLIHQQLTHQKIHFSFFLVETQNFASLCVPGAKRVKIKSLPRYAFPKTIHLYLIKNSLL